MAVAVAYLRAADRRTGARGDRAGAGLRDLPLRYGGRRRTAGAGDAAPDFSFPLDEVLAAITPNTRVVFLTNPNNPTGVGMPLERDPHHRAAPCRPARSSSSTRPTRSSPASRFIPGAGRLPERDRRADVLEGLRPGRPAHRLPGRRAGDRWTPSGGRCRSTASTSRRPSRIQAALDDLDHLNGYLRQVAESKALLYAACDRLGINVLEEPLELRARLRRRSDRRAREGRVRQADLPRAIARPSRDAPAASAWPPASSTTPAARLPSMEEVLCAAP